jgi:hypothetical protein
MMLAVACSGVTLWTQHDRRIEQKNILLTLGRVLDVGLIAVAIANEGGQ